MLLVKDSMTREVVVLSPETTAAEALGLCRERRIRHLPVLEEGRLVGIVSDRDLRSAAPALGDPERASVLEKIRVSHVMTAGVISARPDDPIEEAVFRVDTINPSEAVRILESAGYTVLWPPKP